MNRKVQRVNLAIRNPHVSSSAEEVKCEPALYENTAVRGENIPATPGPKFSSLTQLFAPLTVCWLILLVIIILHIYFISVISENNTKLSAERNNLTELIHELQMENKNLTDQIMKMETSTTELDVSRAQWIIDVYCPRASNVRTCAACQLGWYDSKPSCYAYYDVKLADQLSWKEAQGNCRGKISDLTVVADEGEKNYVNGIIIARSDITGYLIGLRAVEGKWKWINGSDMTNNAWINPPANNSQCVISVKDQGWKPVNCENKNPWICKTKALSV